MSSSTKPYEDYILSRVVDAVELLHSQSVLSSADLAAIKGHLSLPRTATGVQPSVSGLSPERGSSEVGAISRRANPPPPRKVAPRPALDATCRALWDYAQENPQADDLPFTAGQLITLVEETNADWWRGTLNGRSGIFPSNYVERIQSAPVPPLITHPWGTHEPVKSAFSHSYRPAPPFAHGGVAEKEDDLQPVTSGVPPDAPPKKRFGSGKLAGQMGMSAVRGLGFGAGFAVAGDVVNVIL